MRFTFDSKVYKLDFERRNDSIKRRVGTLYTTNLETKEVIESPEIVEVPARYAYTTATIWEKVGEDAKGKETWKVYRTATVGCYHRDPHSNERGRMSALRCICGITPEQRKGNGLPKAFKEELWACYFADKERQRVIAREQALIKKAEKLGLKFTDKTETVH